MSMSYFSFLLRIRNSLSAFHTQIYVSIYYLQALSRIRQTFFSGNFTGIIYVEKGIHLATLLYSCFKREIREKLYIFKIFARFFSQK